jgi:hypothetical protein
MDNATGKLLLESSLERAAEVLGDLTPHVFEAYYRRIPEARQRFEELGHLHQPVDVIGFGPGASRML